MLLEASHEWSIRPYLKNGYPALYYQFLANVMHQDMQDYIVPLPNTSATAARWLKKQNLAADIIYIDGSHEEDDVYADLKAYWDVLRKGGVICGDDWYAEWYGVICGVNRFARERDLKFQIADRTWIFQKP